MKLSINDFEANDVFYFPLQFGIMDELVLLYDHEAAMYALWFASMWFKDENFELEFSKYAGIIAKEKGVEAERIEAEMKTAFNRIVHSVMPLVKKMQRRKTKSEAGKKGMENRWRK